MLETNGFNRDSFSSRILIDEQVPVMVTRGRILNLKIFVTRLTTTDFNGSPKRSEVLRLYTYAIRVRNAPLRRKRPHYETARAGLYWSGAASIRKATENLPDQKENIDLSILPSRVHKLPFRVLRTKK